MKQKFRIYRCSKHRDSEIALSWQERWWKRVWLSREMVGFCG